MSEENVDRFLEATEAFNRGDVERWLESFHPDAVLELRNAELEGEYSGHDGLRRFFAEFAETFEMFELHCPDVRDLGDRVLGLGTLHTIGRGSRMEQEGPVAFVSTFRDGLCTHVKDYGDWGQALEAAGLWE
jgi:ketosteroid isomerase-like protein